MAKASIAFCAVSGLLGWTAVEMVQALTACFIGLAGVITALVPFIKAVKKKK